MKDLPDNCYRYYSPDNFQYVEELISDGTLYFAFPREFNKNDAYDCKTYKIVKGPDFNSDLEYLKNLYEKTNLSHLPYTDRNLALSSRINYLGGEINFVDIMINGLDGYSKCIWDENKFGILCVSHNGNSPEMWTNYTKNHAGFCVELNLKLILQTILTNEVSDARVGPGSISCAWVEYVDEPKKMTVHEYLECGPDILFLKIKEKYWFEEEIRIIIPECIKQKISFPDGFLQNIKFGKNVKQEHIDRINKLVEKRIKNENHNEGHEKKDINYKKELA